MGSTSACKVEGARAEGDLRNSRALVYHYNAPRAPRNSIGKNRVCGCSCLCRNYTYIILEKISPLAARNSLFLGWWFLIGERGAWGLGSLTVDTMQRGARKNRYVSQAWKGKIEGIRLWLKTRNSLEQPKI